MKKLIIQIFTITTLIVVLNYIVITNQNKKQQEKVNDVIVNIVGTIKQEYPDLEDEKIIKILNDEENNAIKGIGTLQRYGINTEEVYAIDGLKDEKKEILLTSSISIISLTIIVTILIINYKNKKSKKIENIINYIEEINKKNYNLKIEENTEDELSNLTNELYKITIMLKEQAELSKKDKNVLQRSLEDISHQIKTPLTSMIGYLSLLSEIKDMPQEQRNRYIDIALDKSYRLEDLINELFDVARFNSEKIVLEKEELNLNLMLEQIIDDFYPTLREVNKSIKLNYNEPISINGDPDKLSRVFNNLIKNAISYSKEESEIVINLKKDNNNAIVEVINKGKQISKEKLSKIFEKFYRLDSARTSRTGGSGLGLAIAKDIVELHNGTIIAESNEEETTFRVTLPLK